MDFVFIAASASARRLIAEKLEEYDVPFIDVGMGLEQVESSIHGLLRATTSTATTRNLARERLPVPTPQANDIYTTNIQVARPKRFQRILGRNQMEETMWVLFRLPEGIFFCISSQWQRPN